MARFEGIGKGGREREAGRQAGRRTNRQVLTEHGYACSPHTGVGVSEPLRYRGFPPLRRSGAARVALVVAASPRRPVRAEKREEPASAGCGAEGLGGVAADLGALLQRASIG